MLGKCSTTEPHAPAPLLAFPLAYESHFFSLCQVILGCNLDVVNSYMVDTLGSGRFSHNSCLRFFISRTVHVRVSEFSEYTVAPGSATDLGKD